MLQSDPQSSPHSMKRSRSGVTGNNGASRSIWNPFVFVIFGILCLLQLPVAVDGCFTCPTNCTCDSYKVSGNKYQNITCTGLGLTEVPSDDKAGSCVIKLDLSNNNISVINQSNFQYFVNLIELDISNNHISSIASEVFANLTSLQYLNLGANEGLESLPEGLFDATPLINLSLAYNTNFVLRSLTVFDDELYSLNISHTSLTAYPRSSIKRISGLVELDISYNNISELAGNSFNQNVLRRINLQGNQITSLGDGHLASENLVELDLSHNRISVIDEDALDDNGALTYLNLSYNKIQKIDPDLFEDARRLQVLDLSNNNLFELRSATFEDTPNLSTIDLSGNNFSSLAVAVFDPLSSYSLDISLNPWTCDCDFRDFLYSIMYDANRNLDNQNDVTCNGQHVYLDWDDTTCFGNLGSTCTSVQECMVQNAVCENHTCTCQTSFYDNNGVTTAAGLCRPQVVLDIPCDMDAACSTANSMCSGRGTKRCLCIADYYDDDPNLVGGNCYPKLDLGGDCTFDTMCKTSYASCGSSDVCACQSDYYDSNTDSVDGGECLPKLALHSTCNYTDQCLPANSECVSNVCTCSAFYYEIEDSGLCQGASSFFSCYPDNTSTVNINFVHAASTDLCEEHCFSKDARYYLVISNICMCGNIDINGTCCPPMTDSCNSREYIGTNISHAKSGMILSPIEEKTIGVSSKYNVTTTLRVIDQIQWNFGDSPEIIVVNSSASLQAYTYSVPGQYNLTISACNRSTSVCDTYKMPVVNVQVPPQNLTTYLSGPSKTVSTETGVVNFSAVFEMGHDFEYIFQITDPNNVTRYNRTCEAGWVLHRDSCLKLGTAAATFSVATSTCASDNATLMKINHESEIQDIMSKLGLVTEDLLLSGDKSSGIWTWDSDGTKTILSDRNLIVRDEDHNCLVIDGTTRNFTTASCTDSKQYACSKEPANCHPKSELLDNRHCFVLASTAGASDLPWSGAQAYCESTWNGWLANITDVSSHNTASALLTANSVSEAYFSMHEPYLDGFKLVAGNRSYNDSEYAPAVDSTSTGNCWVTRPGNVWARQDCSKPRDFFCEYRQNSARQSILHRVVGDLRSPFDSGSDAQTLVPSEPLTDPSVDTEVILFPEYSFEQSGNLRYLVFRTTDVPSGQSFDMAVQIYKLSCPTGTGSLVRAGCENTKFATCSTSSPSCVANTCSANQYFCKLSNRCKSKNEPCTCNSESGHTTSCSSNGTPPQYTLSSQIFVKKDSPGEDTILVAANNMPVGNHYVVGVQYPSGRKLLKCDNDSVNLITAYITSYTGWMPKNSHYPTSSKTDEDMACFLKLVYTETVTINVPESLAYLNTPGRASLIVTLIDTDRDQLDVNIEEEIKDIRLIHPTVQENSTDSNNLGIVHTAVGQEYNFTFLVHEGTNKMLSFNSSSPKSFQVDCPADAQLAVSSGLCNATLVFTEEPYGYVNYSTSDTGTHIVNATFTNDLRTETKSITIKSERRISGLNISLQTLALIQDNVPLGSEVEFQTTLTNGTGVTFEYEVDGVDVSSSTNVLTHTFTKIGTSTVTAIVTNILGQETIDLMVYVKQAANITSCTFPGSPLIAVINVAIDIVIQCTVEENAEIRAIFHFSDDNSTYDQGTVTATSTDMSISQAKTFTNTLQDVQVTVYISDPFQNKSVSTTIDVYNSIPSVDVQVSSANILFGDTLIINVSVPASPGNYGLVEYTVDFGNSVTQSSSNSTFSTTYASIGSFTINVTACNGPSCANTVLNIRVYSEVTGLRATDNGPVEQGDTTIINAYNTNGNLVSFTFNSSEFNVTQSTGDFAFTFVNTGQHVVSITCSNPLSSETISLTVYVLEATEIITEGLKRNGVAISGCFESGISNLFEITVIHFDTGNLSYTWSFGDNDTVDSTSTREDHTYSAAGNFTLNVTVKYYPKNASKSISTTICIEDSILNPLLNIPYQIGLPSTLHLNLSITVMLDKGTSVTFDWTINANVTGFANESTLDVQITSPGYYNVSVFIANSISSASAARLFQVLEEISGITVACPTCIEDNGNFYVQRGTSKTFNIQIVTGTNVSFAWNFDDGDTGSGNSVPHTYASLGTYNMTIIASNVIHTLTKALLVHVETDFTSVEIRPYGTGWLDNILIPTKKEKEVHDTVRLNVIVLPAGMLTVYMWQFDSGLNVNTTTDIFEYNFTTTGLKTCTVTAFTRSDSITSTSFEFYVIEEITNITVKEGTNVLSNSSNYFMKKNVPFNISATSSQIVPDTVKYQNIIKHGTALINSNMEQSIGGSFTATGTMSILVSVENSLNEFNNEYIIIVLDPVTGPYINVCNGGDGNVTSGTPISLCGGSATGLHRRFNWSLLVAPTGHPPLTGYNQNVTLTPNQVGRYVVLLSLSNDVSSNIEAKYPINVVEAVTGLDINVTLTHSDAVEVGTNVTLYAVLATGTNLTFSWVAYGGVNPLNGATENFTITFGLQAYYKINLTVSNYASSGSASKSIYSLIRISSINIQNISGATYNSAIKKYVGQQNARVQFESDISSTDYVVFLWTINSSSVSSSSNLDYNFNEPGTYYVSLNASNRISSADSQVIIIIQAPIADFTVKGCSATYVINSNISLTFNYSAGTDVSVELDGITSSVGTKFDVSYNLVGLHTINITASNYVSSVLFNCTIATQGIIANLSVTVSQYRFSGFPITLTAAGDYLDSASFYWVFPNGDNKTTTTPTVDVTFSTNGSFSVRVNISNEVSWKEVDTSIVVQSLLCPVPTVQIDGNSELRRKSGLVIELAVMVSTSDCSFYTTSHSWTAFVADSCSAPLTIKQPISNESSASTSILQLSPGTLPYNSYCLVYEVRYDGTPVSANAHFKVTTEAQRLKAIIAGGEARVANAGWRLILDGTPSYDPDKVDTLEFSWSCTDSTGTPTANAVASQINALTSGNATLTGITLTENDFYTVTLTVSAAGRQSGQATQNITVVSGSAPVVGVSCVTCDANENYHWSFSNRYCFRGYCSSGCDTTTTYSWTVRNSNTNTVTTVTDSQTTTGTNNLNFCLKSGTLLQNTPYTFRLEARTGGETGYAEMSLSPSTVPESGTVNLTAPAEVVPLTDQVIISYQNWQDNDNRSALYYKTVASHGNDSYIISYGTQATIVFYLSPWPGTSYAAVTVTGSVINDLGAEVIAITQSINFKAPVLLLSQTDNMSYMIDQVKNTMPTLAKQNNPNLLVRYIIPALQFLNDQSVNGVNTTAVRMALRDLFANALDGMPYSRREDILQLASALKYLAAQPGELSKNTLSLLGNSITTLLNSLDSTVQEGLDIQTDSLLETVAYMQSGLQSITSITSDTPTLIKLGNLDDYKLPISSRSTTVTYSSEAAMQLALVTLSINQRTQLTVVQLKSMVVGEAPLNITLNDGSVVYAMHAPINNHVQAYTQGGATIQLVPDILDETGYTQASVYHVTVFNSINPYNFVYNSGLSINTQTIQLGFLDLNGNPILVTNLSDSKQVRMHLFADSSTPYTVPTSGLVDAPEYRPREGVTVSSCTSLTANKAKVMTVPLPSDSQSAIHIQLLPEYTLSQATGILTAKLSKDSTAYTSSYPVESVRPKEVTYNMSSNVIHNHLDYTFFIPLSERLSASAFSVELSSTHSTRVCVPVYYSKCSYFNTQSTIWDTNGCLSQEESIPTVASCKCNHMTSYGSGLLLSPDQIDFTDLTDLDVANNPVAIITCSIILGLYIILVIICRRMDLLDIKHISSIPLCGKDSSFKYEVMVFTGRQLGAGTSAHVGIQLIGSYAKTAQKHIYKEGAFQRNCSDTFIIAHDVNLGEVKQIRVWHDNTGSSPSWYLDHVVISDLQTDQQYYFYCQSWLTLEETYGKIQQKIPAAGARDRDRFGHRFKMALFNSLADKHLWLSLLNRPAQSRFTRVQRATCCVTLLFTFICVNAMWYGLLKKDNQDIGWDSFSWEEIILAIVTNVMVLPINLGLIFLFKKSRSKANLFETVQKPQTAQTIEIENDCENSQGGSFESSNTGEIPYDLDRESTIDSVPANTRGLHRSRHVSRKQRENTDDTLDRGKKPLVSVTKSSRSPLLGPARGLKWPDNVDYANDMESRPSTSSTMDPPQKPLTKGTGAYKKRKTVGKAESDELLAELDKMEKDLKEAESRPVRSASSRRSDTSARSRRLTISELESLEDILHSDDETGPGNKTTKKPALKSKPGPVFNPRADPRINGNGNKHLISRGSIMSGMSTSDIQEPEASGSGVTAGLRPAYYSELTMESRDIRHIPVHKEKCSLPAWCVYVAYVLCFLLCVFSIIIVILYCFKFGADEALKWVLACLLSLVLSLCVVEPLKALMISIYLVAMFKNVDKNDEDDCIEIDPTIDMSYENIQEQTFEPISGFALVKAKEEGRKIRRMKTIIRQFFAYMFYLWVIMVIVYVNFHYNSYLFNKYVETSFMNTTTTNYVSYNNVSTIEEFWDWTENVFADTIHLQDSHTDEEHGFLLGTARMRLIRSISEKCQASSAASSLGASVLTDRICYGNGGFNEDTGFYGERWNESSFNKSWKYVQAHELGGSDRMGFVATYSGGGYIQTLGTTYAETLTIIQDLKDKGWIDLRTRAVIFEFSFYSPGSDMTAVTALLVEFPLTGGVITSYEILSQKLLWFQENRVDSLMVMECILLLVVIYSLVHITLQIREKKAAYFKDFWHWYEILTTLATIVSIGMYLGCVVEATNTFNNFLDDQSGFTNFEHVAYVHVGMRYLYAWLLFLLMYKVVKQLRFIKFLYVYGLTLSTAYRHIIGAFLIYVVLLLTYAQIGYLMYGRDVAGFESVGQAVVTLTVIIKGTYNFWPMLDHQPVFSHFYLYSYYAFAYGILVALVISILQSCYRINKSKMYYKDSLDMKDYEMIEFMMNRFKLWAGIKKPKPAFRRVHFPDLPSPPSRSTTSHSSRSTESADSAGGAFDPDSYEPYLQRMAGRLGPTWQLFLRRFDELEVLDQEEQKLVTKTEALVKDLNLRCRINELERQGKEILSWQNPSSSKQPAGESKHRQSHRLANRDNQGQKAPSTVTGALSRVAATPPGKEEKPVRGKRPLSDQGGRPEQATGRRASAPEKGKIHTFLKSVKPSKPAWSKDDS